MACLLLNHCIEVDAGGIMKLELKYTALAAALALSCGTVSAQSSRTERAEEYAQSLSYADYVKGRDLRASQIVGSRVRNAAGDNLGEIEELVIPTRDQDDMLVVVSVGGVLDVGDKLVALPYDDLRVSPDGDTFYFDRTEEQLKAAPAYTYEAQAETQTRSQPQTARDAQRAPTASSRAATTDQPRPTAQARAAAPTGPAVAKQGNVVLDAWDYRASDLIGAAVLDDRGERVAKVDDIVVSTEDDKLHAVLAFGGFAGFGSKLITIPVDGLQITVDDGHPQVRIAMTGEQLQQLVDSRPDFHYERQVAQAPANGPRG
jgi:sporulation protein YlmC with PRC-barrel domain